MVVLCELDMIPAICDLILYNRSRQVMIHGLLWQNLSFKKGFFGGAGYKGE
jgi:hypothetical protein